LGLLRGTTFAAVVRGVHVQPAGVRRATDARQLIGADVVPKELRIDVVDAGRDEFDAYDARLDTGGEHPE
jgi:hypothetical protein